MSFFKQFGGKVTPQLKEQYGQSPNWRNGQFQNLQSTVLNPALSQIPEMLYKQLTRRAGQMPDRPLPVKSFERDTFLSPQAEPTFIWYGHSVVLMRLAGQTILVDPMLGPDTTPIVPMDTRRFSRDTLDLIDDFPEIDLLLLTHDHYDHLDMASIQKLRPKTQRYFVALGVKRHLLRWGVEAERITEFDWWDTQRSEGLEVTFTPTQHFSGRGLTDRQRTLWGGWAFRTPQHNIWFSGDGGYGAHFRDIGARLGPFDFAFMECGQYNDDWRPVHLFPDESVQAARDAGVAKAMPVHWGAFALSYQHRWHEPVEDFITAANTAELDFLAPALGVPFGISTEMTEPWWMEYL